MGLYLYASGVQRQNFTVLSKLGICTSYTDLMRNEEVKVRSSATAAASENNPDEAMQMVTSATEIPTSCSSTNNPAPLTSAISTPLHTSSTSTSDPKPADSDPKPKKRRLGLLRLLSNGLRVQTRTIASVGLFGEVYDNINFMSRTAEQVIGRHGELS